MLRMARSIEELFREASDLPDRDRAQLAGMLIESLDHERDSDVEAAWAAEVEERVRQVDAGEVEMIPWEQVRAELFARLDVKS
jgi:putative addiction module component (TIGR02574 family)